MLEKLSRGCFVFKYCRKIVTNAELLRCSSPSKITLVHDTDWHSKMTLEDELPLSIDASIYANVARSFNHRCNLFNGLSAFFPFRCANLHPCCTSCMYLMLIV